MRKKGIDTAELKISPIKRRFVAKNDIKRMQIELVFECEKELISWKISAFFLAKKENNPCILCQQLLY